MFASINNIPARLLKERVYVAVDFSQGDLYTEYVITLWMHRFIMRIIINETNVFLVSDILCI